MTEKEKKLPIPPSLPADCPRPRLSSSQALLKILKGTVGVKQKLKGDRPPKELSTTREEVAFNLRIQGYEFRDIAKKIGVKSSQNAFKAVRRASKRLSAEWVVEQHEIRHEHSQRLEHIICEAAAAWERSKLDAVTVTDKSEVADGGDQSAAQVDRTTQTKGQVGDPKFLTVIQSALKEIREMMGANAPAQVNVQADVNIGGVGFKSRDEMKADIDRMMAEKFQRQMQPTNN